MGSDPTSGTAPATQTEFFSRTFDEALALTEEARDYLAEHSVADRSDLNRLQQVDYAIETMRLTTRLTFTMAWLLAQRAAHHGELSYAELRDEEWRLGGHQLCLQEPALGDKFPPHFCDLLRRSFAFYTRISRLDEMAARN